MYQILSFKLIIITVNLQRVKEKMLISEMYNDFHFQNVEKLTICSKDQTDYHQLQLK